MARVRGSNSTTPIDPSLELVSMTEYPIETLFSVWWGSRNEVTFDIKLLNNIRCNDHHHNNEEIEAALVICKGHPEMLTKSDSEYVESVKGVVGSRLSAIDRIRLCKLASVVIEYTAELCIKCDVPASESVSFTFVINNCPVALREQLVRCLSGDTVIKLLDGTYSKIEDLAGKKDFYVYSYDIKTSEVVPGLVKGVQKTRTESPVLVEFDDGSIVKCTHDHRFLTVGGNYVQASELEGMSIEPLYYSTSDNGYELVYQKGLGRRQYTHRMVKEVATDMVVHHSDKNKKNNTPSNLEEMTYYEHTRLHRFTTESMLELWRSEDFRRKVSATARATMNKLWEDPEFRSNKVEASRKLMRKLNDDPEFRRKSTEGVRKWFSIESNREKHAERMRTRDMSYLEDEEVLSRMSESQKKRYEDPEERRKVGLATTNRFLSMSSEEYEKFYTKCSESAKESWKSRSKSPVRESMKLLNTRDDVKILQMRGKISRILRCSLALSDTVTESNYTELAIRSGMKPHSVIRLSTILKYFESFQQALDYSVNYNHKVVKVTKSEDVIEFYDMEVDKYHNFAIKLDNSDSGVFVHNSKVASFWTQTSRTADLTAMDVRIDRKIYDNPEAKEIYDSTIDQIRDAYQMLSELGIPTEDIRLSPECRLHRVYWMISLRSLRPVLSKRMDWMAQSTLWTPIISDVCKILDDCGLLSALRLAPPIEYDHKEVISHKYDNENQDRFYSKDPQPVDPLWLSCTSNLMPSHTNITMYDDMKSRYIEMWNEDICKILMWDKTNPEMIGPYDRPLEWFTNTDNRKHYTDEVGAVVSYLSNLSAKDGDQ